MKRTKEEALQTRETLLDSAQSVFLKKGYASTTLQDIAEDSAMTRGAVYWHFKGKEEVFMALYQREHIFINNLVGEILSNDLDPLEKLETAAEAIITNFYTNKRFAEYIELSRFKIESAFLNKLLLGNRSTYDYVVEEFKALAEIAMRQGKILPHLKADDVARTVYTLITGIYRLKFSAAQDFGQLETSLAMINSYFDSIKTTRS